MTSAGKVSLIGHSQGAQDSRYVAGARPDLVAPVTTVGDVNKGATLADVLQAANTPVLTQLVNAVGSLIDILSIRRFRTPTRRSPRSRPRAPRRSTRSSNVLDISDPILELTSSVYTEANDGARDRAPGVGRAALRA